MKGRLVVDHANYITEMMQALADEKEFKLDTWPKDSAGKNDWSSCNVYLETKEYEANFQVQQMPGCCAVLVLSYIRTKPYSQEIVDEVIAFVEEAAKMAAFGSVAMTQCVPQFSKMFWKHEPWIKCLNRKWTATPAFRNGKSGNLVTYLFKDLEQADKMKGFEQRYVVAEKDDESTPQGS